MNLFRWIIVTALLLGAVLGGAAGCGSGGVPQAKYDALKSELNDYKLKLVDCQRQLAEVESQSGEAGVSEQQYADLQSEKTALEADFAELASKYKLLMEQVESGDTTGQLKALQDAYDKLSGEYDALQEQYEAMSGGATADEISQAIFALINEERASAGLSPFTLGTNLIKLARENSRDMAEQGDYLYSTYPGVWQKILISASGSNAEQIADAALRVWKTNIYKYENTILTTNAKYGAVGVVEESGVYYITFMAATFR